MENKGSKTANEILRSRKDAIGEAKFQEIISSVAKEEGISEEEVMECWAKFAGLPVDQQDRVIEYFNEDKDAPGFNDS